MFFDEIIYGTQYYRAPTPLPEEWGGDLKCMADMIGVDVIQLRIQWRRNERVKNEYDFGDIDRLFELAQKHKLRVIVKFLLETAPQYVFEEYDGYRVNPDRSIIRAGSHGAFYIGGWLPC
ncbi:MAG: beta-galactosidase, partial [Firmicutes bacterium]|nr:beta-galactosidase [Bacillota bacterium]